MDKPIEPHSRHHFISPSPLPLSFTGNRLYRTKLLAWGPATIGGSALLYVTHITMRMPQTTWDCELVCRPLVQRVLMRELILGSVVQPRLFVATRPHGAVGSGAAAVAAHRAMHPSQL